MFGKTTADGAMQAVRAIIAARSKIKAAIVAAEVELQDAKAGRLSVLGVIAINEAERALTAEPCALPDVGDLRAATEREELAVARITGLRLRLDGTDAQVVEIKSGMEAAWGEYRTEQITEAVRAYTKSAEQFLAALWRVSAVVEALIDPYTSEALRSTIIPDVTQVGTGADMAETHWRLSGDQKALAVYTQHSAITDVYNQICSECVLVETAAKAKTESGAESRRQALEKARLASGGPVYVGPSSGMTDATVII